MKQTEKWYQLSGPEGDVVLSTRIRLARNLSGIPFPAQMTAEQKKEVSEKIRAAVPASMPLNYLDMHNMTRIDALSLVERHLISPEFSRCEEGSALLLSEDESVSLMLCEEDHLRMQVMRPGLRLEEAYEVADRLDTALDETLHFAFDDRLGYLTQCPTNLGTGMRASLMLHLPALTENGAMSRISTNLSKLGLVIRGTYGEGSNVIGAMYQLSNQITLGLSEKEAVENLQNITMQLISEERKTRASLSKNINVQDKVGRSAGVLKNARLLSCDEYMKLISNVRFGIAEKLLSGITLEDIHTLTVAVQPATMAAAHGSNLSAGQRDILRADEVRKALKALQ